MIARELYLQKIRPFMDTELVKVFTGVRRCGKSVLLELVQKELQQRGIASSQILALNFESAVDGRVRSTETVLAAMQDKQGQALGKRLYLFFDEIQELPSWEKLINSLLVDRDVDIYLTGSNARMLSGELATYIGGRYIEVRVYPFSFAEVLALLEQRGKALSIEEAFLRYISWGGFPFLYNYLLSNADAQQYISDIFESTILKDIAQRNAVRNIAQLRSLVLYFIANAGNTFSAGSLVKYLKSQRRSISMETIYNYIDHCQAACLLHLVQRQDLSGKALLLTREKIYLADHGIREAVYGNNTRDINQTLENIVYMELLRRGYDVTVGRVGSAEIDFCADRGSTRIYVQVCYLLASEQTIQREFSALESIPDNFPKFVLSMDQVDLSRNGINHMKIRDFLTTDIAG